MITVYPHSGKPLWIDLRDPTPEEIAKACTDYGLYSAARVLQPSPI